MAAQAVLAATSAMAADHQGILERGTVVALVLAAHAVLLLGALWKTDIDRTQAVTPATISVHWIAPPDAEPRPAPPAPVSPTPAPVRHAVEHPRPTPHKPHVMAAKPAPVAPAANLPTAVAAPPPPPQRHDATAEGTETVTPPRADAAYLSNPPPAYPTEARRNRQEGRVVLHVLVSADGHPQAVDIARSSGFPILDDAASGAIRHWRFVPAHRGEEAVDAWVLVPISFTLRTR